MFHFQKWGFFRFVFFAVNTTVIFVTEVIFLGIYCTFLSWGTLRNQHLSMRFLKKKKKKKKDELLSCQLEKQSVMMQPFKSKRYLITLL